MSIVIDGKDILAYNSYLAIVMSESLDDMLGGKAKEIPKSVLREAKNLFLVGMDFVREKRGLSFVYQHWREQRETFPTYKLLTDMLRKVKEIPEEDIDSELEKLAIAMQRLESDEEEVFIDRENYQTLQKLFNVMHEESGNYIPAFGQHSPYSVGVFDCDDE